MADPSEFASDIIVARRLFLEGADAVESHDRVRVTTGLLLTDLAVETLLKAALRRYDKEVPDLIGFLKLVGDVRAAARDSGGPKLDYLPSRLEPLRKMRNAVMHEGRAQLPEEAKKEVARARDALTMLVRDVFGFDFVNLRFSEFVKSPLLKYLMDEAEQRFAAQKYQESAAVCHAVHRNLMGAWTAYVRKLFWLDRLAPRHEEDARRDDLMFSLAAGVYLPDLKRFYDVTDGSVAHVNARGKIAQISFMNTVWSIRPIEQQVADARFALDFCGGMILQIEPRFGEESLLDNEGEP
jgi:cation transport regulator ChaC